MKGRVNYGVLGTMFYGLIVIVPVAVVFLFLVKLTEILEQAAATLGLDSAFGAGVALVVATIAALALVMLVSWAVGSVMRRLVSYSTVETSILNHIPGYQIIANIARGFVQGEAGYPAALVDIHGPGIKVLGFVMEEHGNGLATVYVPSVPVPSIGNIYIVERERLTILDARETDVTHCVSQWGIGLQKIVAADSNRA